jgi:hypothetical protein
MEDAKQIVCDLLLWGEISLLENHDFSTVLLDKERNELESKSCESVSVGNHNLELFAAHCAFQYGFKPATLIVEGTKDVFDDFGSWVLFSHELDGSIKVVSLFWT